MSDSDCAWDDDDYEVDLQAVKEKKTEMLIEDDIAKEPEHVVPKPQPPKEKPAYMKKAPTTSLPTFDDRELTAQEKEEMQKKSDMLAGMDLCGVTIQGSELENLETVVEFREYAKKLGEPLTSRAKSKHYVDFITTLMTVAVHPLDASHLRLISASMKALADAKTAQEKNNKKGSSKPSIKSAGNKSSAATGGQTASKSYGDDAVYDEYDDFM